MKIEFLLGCLLACSPVAPRVSAQDTAPKHSAIPNSSGPTPTLTPSPGIERLAHALVGTWAAAESIDPSPELPQGGTGSGTEMFRLGPGEMSLIEEYQSRGSAGDYSGHGVLWWDEKAGWYAITWCDNISPGGCYHSQASGKWEANSVVFITETQSPAQKVVLRETYADITPSSITQTLETGPSIDRLKRIMTIKLTKER